MKTPVGATHSAEFYGETLFYKAVEYDYYNPVNEGNTPEKRVNWYWWDLGKWCPVGNGFSSRRLELIV